MGDPQAKIALLAGASGLTGACALDALLGAPDIARVVAVSRRPLQREHSRLANRIVQFDRLESQLKGVSCDVALCCLGTTIRQAGSQQRFRAVDVDSVLAFARTARAAGAQRFVVVSSVGADPNSRNFYLRTKGEMEQGLEEVGFTSLDILQPSVLLGWRRDMRPLELLGRLAMPLSIRSSAAATWTTAVSRRAWWGGRCWARSAPGGAACSVTPGRGSRRWRGSAARAPRHRPSPSPLPVRR